MTSYTQTPVLSGVPPPSITVGNTFSRLNIPIGCEYYYGPMLQRIDEALSFDVHGREYMNVYNTFTKNGDRLWDGKKHLINLTSLPLKKVAWKQYITEPFLFLTGNIYRVIEVMECFGIIPELIPSEEKIESKDISQNKIQYEWNENFESRDYQKYCVEQALAHKRGLLQIATGGGKTIIAANLIHKIGLKPVLFLVTTKDLLYQAYNSFNLALNNPGVGIIGDGRCEIDNINVATIQSVVRAIGTQDEYKQSIKQLSDFIEDGFSDDKSEVNQEDIVKIQNLLNETRVVIFDECQHAPATTCQLAITRCVKANYRYGMSATPFREDGEDLTIEGLFGKNLVNISSSYLIDNNYLVKPQITMIDLDTPKSRKMLYNEEYRLEIVENNLRNQVIASFAATYADEGKSVLILIKQIKHGKTLEKMIEGSLFVDGSKSSKKRNQALEDLRNKDLKIMIATSLADEGIDIPDLDVLILGGSGKSKTRALQRIGRVIRKSPNKTESFVIDFLDSGHHSRKHSRSRKKIYESEERFRKIEVIRINDLLDAMDIKKSDDELI